MGKLTYSAIPVHNWRYNGTRYVQFNRTVVRRIMKIVGERIQDGAEVHMQHRVVNAEFATDKPYDVMDVVLTWED